MNTLEVIVQRTEEKVDSASGLLQSILTSAAEDDGEFLVPLSADKAAALREVSASHAPVPTCPHMTNLHSTFIQALGTNRASLDESFLSTTQAWMRKSQENGLEGMVTILQKLLQYYAAVLLIDDASVSPSSGMHPRAVFVLTLS